MRYIATLILTLFIIRANAQASTYNLVLFDSCNGSYEYALLYSLEKQGTTFTIQDTLGTIQLEDAGNYKLRHDLEFIHIEVTIEPGMNVDTLSRSKIHECLEPLSHPNFMGYCCCSTKCTGFHRDYFNNGNVRVEGTFEDGKPVGQVKYFNPDGTLKIVKHYNKKGILTRTEEF